MLVLIGLFLFQRKGTAHVGALFGPIMAVWFVLLALLGARAIVEHPAVFPTPNPDDVPYVPLVDRVEVHRLPANFSQVIVQYGLKDQPDIPAALAQCAEVGLVFDLMDTSFFLGRETLIPKLGSEMAYWRELLFIALFRNAGSTTAFFRIPSNRVVDLGAQVVL